MNTFRTIGARTGIGGLRTQVEHNGGTRKVAAPVRRSLSENTALVT